MNLVIFIVAALLFLVGLWLLVVDRKRRTRTAPREMSRTSDADRPVEDEQAPERPAADDAAAAPLPVADTAPAPAEHSEPQPAAEEGPHEPAELAEPAAAEPGEPAAAESAEPAPAPDGATAIYAEEETEVDVDAEEALYDLPASHPDEEAKPAPQAPTAEPDEPVDSADPDAPEGHEENEEQAGADTAPATAASKRRFSLPGFMNSARRERRDWAKEHDYFFAKSDEFLSDEWSRGAAATGAVARNVVSGTACGHEMHLVDLGGVCVMAMRRGSVSDVVIDARRASAEDAPGTGEDLLPVGELHELRVVASEVDVAERFLDERVHAALEALPPAVAAVWCEGNWVLAQFQPHSQSPDWDAVCQPLSMLADAARALPPRRGALLDLKLEDRDPSRPVVEPIELDEVSVPEEFSDPRPAVVTRPEEPVELPSRAQQVSRGVVSSRGVGTDDIAPIASGDSREHTGFDGTKVLRDTGMSSSIFNDISAELGTSFTPEFAARLNDSAAQDEAETPVQDERDAAADEGGDADENTTTNN
ncbi:hypothetical protein [Corynebacterium sp. TAE3-ERU30]|uniref:hypothetical protein n=1 Tax=Corynebacterium sp. TAE3-ERU30 TaxID=2849496 RepID=UPI001C470062|nr:hypothetical protein [Corynebacterium sp. TAE3-ERU30]MBV7282564.1 hypothetical protein [Corynebacterium sp. TAE3-ERU30]